MIEPEPLSEGQLARMRSDPWAAVRRIASGSHYEALGETSFPGSPLPLDELGRSAVGFLYGAFLAQAAGHAQEAEALFAQCLQLLANQRPAEDLWISLTAFAAIGSADSAAALEAFLAGHDMLNPASLAELPLPARGNFLRYCVKHQKLDYAFALVEQAGPEWEPDRVTLEAWGFRIAALSVLDHAQRPDRFAVYAAAYEHLLQAGRVEPTIMRPAVELLFAVRQAEAARNQGDARSTIRHYRHAILLAEEQAGPGLTPALLVSLLQRLGRYHQSVRYFPEAQRSLERSIGIASLEGYKHDVVAGLFSLANILERERRLSDAAILHARRVSIMESDRDFSLLAGQFARHDLARVLLADNEKPAARRILDDVINFARGDNSYDSRLVVSALLSRAEANMAEEGSATAAWQDVNEVLGLEGLSANQLDQVSRLFLHPSDAARPIPPRGLVLRIGELAGQLQQANSAQGAAIAADVAAVLLRFYQDVAGAENLVRRAVRLRDLSTDQAARTEATRRIMEIKFQLLEHDLTVKSDRQLSGDLEIFFAEAAAFSSADWNKALSLTGNLAAEGRSAAAELALKSIADYFAAGKGERIEQAPLLFARLSELTLRIVRDTTGAVALAQRGLAALAAGDAGERSIAIGQRLLNSLTAAEIAAAEAMLSDKAEPGLREAVDRVLGRGEALAYGNRVALLRLAHRLCQEQPAYLGSTIIAALAGLPPPAEPSGPDGARLRGELYLRLSQSALRFLKAPEQAAQLARQGLDVLPEGDDKSAILRPRLLESLTAAEIAAAEAMLSDKAEPGLREAVDRVLGRGEALAYGNRFALLRLAHRLCQEQPAYLGSTIIAALAHLPPPAEPSGPDGARLRGELYLGLSQSTLRFLKEPEQAAQLAQQGLDVLPEGDDKSAILRPRLLESLTAAEIAAAEAMLSDKAEPGLREAVDRVLGRGEALAYGNRFALLRLADRLCQEQPAYLGSTIIVALARLPPPAEPSGPDGARLRGELYLRLSQSALRFLKAPEQAAQLARQGLDVLPEGDDKSAILRLRLLESLSAAEIAAAEAMLSDKAEPGLREAVDRVLGRGEALAYGNRFALLRLADRLCQEQPAYLGSTIIAALARLPPPAEPSGPDGARLRGELYLRLSQSALRFLKAPEQAAQLARQGLDVLPEGDDKSAILRLRLLESLSAAEIAAAEAMLSDKAEPGLREAVDRVLGRGEALAYGNRFALLRLADRLCQEQPAYLGSTIIAALARLPPPAEPSGPDGARLRGELYLRLSQSALRFLKAPEQAAQLAQQGLDVLPEGDDKSAILRPRLLESLTAAEIAAAEAMPSDKAEPGLREAVDRVLGRGEALAYGNRVALLRLAHRLCQEQPAYLGSTIIAALAGLPPPAEPSGPDGARLRGELYLRLSQSALRFLKAPEQAAQLARQGLDVLPEGDGKSAILRPRLLESLTAAEIAAAEAMPSDKAEPGLREAVDRVLGRGEALAYGNRVALLRLAHRLCQEQPAYLGSTIIAALARLPPPAEPSGPDGARLRGELYLRLSQSALRFLKAPEQAAQLARQGLEALPAGEDEKLALLRQRLLESLAKAATLSTSIPQRPAAAQKRQPQVQDCC